MKLTKTKIELLETGNHEFIVRKTITFLGLPWSYEYLEGVQVGNSGKITCWGRKHLFNSKELATGFLAYQLKKEELGKLSKQIINKETL